MYLRYLYIFFLCAFLSACNEAPHNEHPYQEILGRDEADATGRVTRHPVYHVRVPETWRREDPPTNQSNSDTTLPIATFFVGDSIEIHIHNFPAQTLDTRIPPGAQVGRWQRQLVTAAQSPAKTSPIAQAGYWGLYFEGTGQLKGAERTVYAWAFQLGQEQFHALELPGDAGAQHFFRQMRGDVTIKAVGAPEEMASQREAIHRFASSFQLIQEIPTRS